MLKDDEIFIATTDTIIGIGSKINNNNLEKIYELKKRPKTKKIVIIIGSIEQLKTIENINSSTQEYIDKYWPGPTTLLINGNAYRMPNKKGLINFAIQDGPFYLTSANISGQKNCKSIEESIKLFPTIKKIYNFGYGSEVASAIIDVKSGKRLR